MTSTPGAARRANAPAREDAPTRLHEPLPTCVDDLPELPPAFFESVAAGVEQLGVGELTAGARTAIDAHVRLLLAWNQAINLTAIRTPLDVAREHVLDSLAALPILRDAGARRLLDLGSGGGFPGFPLAVSLEAERAVLVESVGKKARFLATVVDATGRHDRVAVAATRAETLAADPHHRGRWQAILVRALGSLAEDAELALPLLESGGLVIVWKGESVEAEMDPARRAIGALGGRLAEVRAVRLDGLRDHQLVVVEKVSATPAAYPRDPATRKRRPW